MKKMAIMNPTNAHWLDFVTNMNLPGLCARLEHEEKPSCDGTTAFARRLLTTYPCIDVEGSLEFFRIFGGVCDCTIHENVCLRSPLALRVSWACRVRIWVRKFLQKILGRRLLYGEVRS